MRALAGRIAAAAVLCICAAMPAHAQRMIAITQAFTATREAAAIYAHSIDLSIGSVLPGADRLMGNRLDALRLWPSGKAGVVITSGPPIGDLDAPTWWRSFRAAPFDMDTHAMPEVGFDASQRLLKIWELPGAHRWIARAGGVGSETCLISAQPWNIGAVGTATIARNVPGRFMVGDAIAGAQGEVAVVVERGQGHFFLCLETVSTAATRGREVELRLPGNALDIRPKSVLVGDGGVIFVLFGGYDLAEGNAQGASWISAIKVTGTPTGEPLRLLGSPQEWPTALVRAPGGQCWCITREPGRDIAYTTLVRIGTKGPEKAEQYPFTGIRTPILLATQGDSASGDTLAALGERVELWPNGKRGEVARRFDFAISAMAWSSNGPVVSTGGTVSVLDTATLESRASLQLQSGEVIGLAEIPTNALPENDDDGDGLDLAAERALGSDPNNPDSDGDGIHDGADPEPARPTNTVRLPRSIVFHGEAAGQELHAYLVKPQPDADARWQIRYDAEQLPALRLYPATNYGERPAYLGLDPQFFSHPAQRLGVLRVAALRSLQSLVDPPESETLVSIRPTSAGPSRVLWMVDDSSRALVDALQETLARPPLCLTPTTYAGGGTTSLETYAAIVLGTAAAARGEIPQSDLLRYTADGGAVLVLPEHAEPGARDVSDWFSLLGLRLDLKSPMAPPYTVVDLLGPARDFPSDAAASGMALRGRREDLPVRAEVPDGAAGPLFLRQFGAGRVAAVADPSVLNPALPDHEAFAQAFFRWLGRAKLDLEDFDGDGLPDPLEDANGNQATDPGETDRFNPDTDGDGLDDGQEDRNRNGIVDDGETDPRNRDSDGDGIYDGADPLPCPALGAPRLLGASPSSGPAEGGTRVSLAGQNLDRSVQCAFGPITARVLRADAPGNIEVIAPPFEGDLGGDVDLVLSRPDGTERTVLPGGFRYTPRSTLNFSLSAAVAGRKHGPLFNGVLSFSLDSPSGPSLARLILVIEAQSGDMLHFGTPRPGPALPQSLGAFQTQLITGNRIMLSFEPATPMPLPSGELLQIPWEYRSDTPPPLAIRISPLLQGDNNRVQAVALTQDGGSVNVACAPFALDVNEVVRRRALP